MAPKVIEKQDGHPATNAPQGHEQCASQVAAFFGWKRCIDLPLATLLLVAFSPIIGVLWVSIKLGSPGPGLYRQERVSRRGRCYMMYKLRSMRQDAEAKTGAVWSTADDPRVTRLGRALRKYHLDELPQLVNVIRGDMSLVGPRPERPEFVEVLSEKIPSYQDRHEVLPGITGLAQLNLPPDTDLDSVRRKLILDLEYVEHATAWMEARLLICTAARLFKVPAINMLGLARSPRLDGGNGRHLSASVAVDDAGMLDSSPPQTMHNSSNGNGRTGHRHESNGYSRRPLSSKPR
jgi:lipopolysaccharide/colanic/teichoic acid biosynthesis glycosyltransferase